ncbi:hypothetical protein ASB1_08470 [Helicobacter heilmannii]|uniref:hypothetical protein n=1 Tax=Helicobacter heilmannii TaxID=35817 RepID=UPI0021FCC346|nr:hypothetical protein [Helicobacter heilmannii]BDQ27171.1 hypothetical protein ASB1_08470 [Helicobacter heilmannii]
MPLYTDLLSQLCAKEDLREEQVRAFWAGVLGGHFSDIELGALLIALKCKGESPQEIAFSVQACLQESQALKAPLGGWWIIAARAGMATEALISVPSVPLCAPHWA